jgi:hypothetical protein
MAPRTTDCRRLYLDILKLLIDAGVYPEPSPEELADVILEVGSAPKNTREGDPDGRKNSDEWAVLRMKQLLGEN